MNDKINTFVVPIIGGTYIDRFLYTLKKYTPDNYSVIVVDQCLNPIERLRHDPRVNLYLRPKENLGFARAMNLGMRMATTKYVTAANDDVEFVHGIWWEGIEQTFNSDNLIKAVNPMSITEPGWGYGCNKDSDEELVKSKEDALQCKFNRELERFEHLPYKKEYTNEDYAYLLTRKNGMIDGIITWMTVFDRKALAIKGLFDERFFPGGGEDYDIGARFYSQFYPQSHPDCGKPSLRYRMVATSRSWAWHHLNGTKHQKPDPLPSSRTNWNKLKDLWEDDWGHPTQAKYRKGEVFYMSS